MSFPGGQSQVPLSLVIWLALFFSVCLRSKLSQFWYIVYTLAAILRLFRTDKESVSVREDCEVVRS